MLTHRFLPKAVKINDREPSIDEETKVLLDKLRQQDESSKKLLETVDKMIEEDIKAETSNLDNEAEHGNLVVAPSLQRMEVEKKEALKQFLRKNPDIGRQYAAEKQVFKFSCFLFRFLFLVYQIFYPGL